MILIFSSRSYTLSDSQYVYGEGRYFCLGHESGLAVWDDMEKRDDVIAIVQPRN